MRLKAYRRGKVPDTGTFLRTYPKNPGSVWGEVRAVSRGKANELREKHFGCKKDHNEKKRAAR